jgi:hypothetical protein
VRLCLALSRPNDRYPQVVEDLDKGREEEETENNRNSVSKGAMHPAILAKGKLSERRPAKINLNTWKAVRLIGSKRAGE